MSTIRRFFGYIKSSELAQVILAAVGMTVIALLIAVYVVPERTTTTNGRIVTDNVTGCQYMTGGITGIYPRIGPDGIKIVGCKEQP